jgi:hypothetical protein
MHWSDLPFAKYDCHEHIDDAADMGSAVAVVLHSWKKTMELTLGELHPSHFEKLVGHVTDFSKNWYWINAQFYCRSLKQALNS